MHLARHVAFALVLATATWPTFAATDYFWNCTTADGIKYADASKCDKGDAAVKVMKGDHSGSTQTALIQAMQTAEKVEDLNTGVCPTNPAYCARPNYGVTEGSPRTQAIVQFMRNRECGFMQRFPQRCTRPN